MVEAEELQLSTDKLIREFRKVVEDELRGKVKDYEMILDLTNVPPKLYNAYFQFFLSSLMYEIIDIFNKVLKERNLPLEYRVICEMVIKSGDSKTD